MVPAEKDPERPPHEQPTTNEPPPGEPEKPSRVDPRLRVGFVVLVAALLVLLRSPLAVSAITVALAVMFLAVGLGARQLLRRTTKLWAFAAFVIVSYAVTSEDAAIDRWMAFRVLGHNLALNAGGALVGATMILRVLALV